MNRHNPRHTRHSANEYGGWVKIVKWFKLSHKPVRLALAERFSVAVYW